MSNRLYLWGDNSISQIGNSNLGTQNSPLLIAPSINVVAAGGYHTIGTSGVARTYVGCGDNTQFQLSSAGVDGTSSVKTPFRSLSNNLPANIIQVEAGLQHSLYLTLDGTVAVRGNNTYGQGSDVTPVNSYGPHIQISAGNYHNIALNTVGQAYIWGRNNYGQTGNGTTGSIGTTYLQQFGSSGGVKYVAAGDYHTAVITGNNRLYLCGLNNSGQLGDNSLITRTSFVEVGGNLQGTIPLYWSKVSLGKQHSAAIDINGDLYTWGYNLYGQLGLGYTTNRSIPTLVSRINGHAWTEVSAGNGYTLAINANGDVYGWGLNTNYQLGDGTNINRSLPVKINNNISGTPVAVKAGPGYHSAALFSDVAVTTTTTTTTLAPIGPNTANFNSCADWNNQNGNATTVGSNGGPSAYGTYDQNGNVWELIDRDQIGPTVLIRGHGYSSDATTLSGSESSYDRLSIMASDNFDYVGFRIASINNPYAIPNFVTIGNVNNAGNQLNNFPPNCGSVAYIYNIGKYPVTNCEYVEFLNAIAKTDTYNVYNILMGLSVRSGINRSGSPGSYVYSIDSVRANKPVNMVSWFDAARYCNWLHNGKPIGLQNNTTTEDGAYTLNGATGGNAIPKNSGAAYWIPTENEWYKAAYYSPNKNGNGSPGYYSYATQSDTVPTCVSASTTGDGPVASSYVCVTTTTTPNPSLQRLTSYKFNNVSIPVSQTFRTDEYRTLFPSTTRMISSVNDTKVNINSTNSIEVTFNLDVPSLSISNLKVLVHTKVDTCVSSSLGLQNISITKISDKIYIINGIDTPSNNPATLLINPNTNLSLLFTQDILNNTDDTIIIPIAPIGVNESDSVYSCYRDYTATTSTTNSPVTTTSTTIAPTTTTTTVRPQIVGSCMSRGSFSKIQLRRATNAQFISANTILASGEPGYATDTRVIKVGDGYTPWSALLPVNISGTIDFPTLLASNNINISSIGSTYVIGATGLALSDHGHDVNDITGLSGVLSNLQPSGNYAPLNHQHVIGDITGFNPSGHKHLVADIVDLNLSSLPVNPHTHSVSDITDISSYYSPIGHTHLLNEFDTSPIYRTNIHTIYPDYGYIYISWAQDQQIQRVTLDGNPIVVLKDIGWPGYYDNYSVDVLLEISIPTDATSVDWTGMVNGWYSQPPEPMPVGTHLVLLRAMGDSIDGHYIGSK